MTTQQSNGANPNLTIGIDLGDRRSRMYVLDAQAERVKEGWAPTTRQGLVKWLEENPGARVVLEAGTHSPWASRWAEELGHETFVANPSELYGRKRRKRRNDKLDAEQLARLGRADPALLHPIRHRGEGAQVDLAILQSRDSLVKARTLMINESSEFQPQLRITKAGNELLRRYLVQAAHFILGPFGPDTDLRRWGEKLMVRGGKNAKKRATVAVARKLSVLLLRLWTTGAAYEPLRNERTTSRKPRRPDARLQVA